MIPKRSRYAHVPFPSIVALALFFVPNALSADDVSGPGTCSFARSFVRSFARSFARPHSLTRSPLSSAVIGIDLYALISTDVRPPF